MSPLVDCNLLVDHCDFLCVESINILVDVKGTGTGTEVCSDWLLACVLKCAVLVMGAKPDTEEPPMKATARKRNNGVVPNMVLSLL